MKSFYNKYPLLIAASIIWAASLSCIKNSEQEIFTKVNLEAKMPGGENIIVMNIDKTIPGNFFRNLNTGQDTEFPVFVNGKCTIETIKGLYMIAFDSEAVLEDGTRKKVRFSGHNTPENSIKLLNDEEYVELKLLVLQ